MTDNIPPGADAPGDRDARADDTMAALFEARSQIPTAEYIRPCEKIERDSREWEGIASLSDRFAVLETLLPLAGAASMTPRADGTPAIVATLRARAPWMTAAIDLIEEQIRASLWAGQPWIELRPMLLVGPAGTGKSHFAKLVAELSGCGHAALSMAAMSDATTIEGTPRGFTQTTPCFPALMMSQTRTANPLLLLDEIDKSDHNRSHGDPRAAVLTLIERSTAKAYWDRCLLAHVDCSYVNWIFTANDVDPLSAPLRSRLDIVAVEPPGEEHYDALCRILIHDLARRWRVPASALPDLSAGADDMLRRRFARHRSARRLARELQAALAASIASTPRTLS